MRYCLSHAAPTIFTVLRLYSTVVHGRYKVVLKHRFMRKKSFAVSGYADKLTWWLWLGDVPRLPDCTTDGLLPLGVEGGRGGLAARATALPHQCRWLGCTRLAFQQKFLKCLRSKAVLRIRIRDPVPLHQRSGMGKKSGSGSGMNNPDYISESLETVFWDKILKSLMRIWDPGWKKFGSRIRDKHPGSATLVKDR
jgi:hypothetical protein